MSMDWIGSGIGAIGIAYAIYTNTQSDKKLNIAHAGLVSLKPAIQGKNRDEVIKAIDDLLSKMKPPKPSN